MRIWREGIPTGYLGLLEQRLGETEVVLYHALSELRALKLQNPFIPIPGNIVIPEPIFRDPNPTKQFRMEEWREYRLRTRDEVERWRQFLSGGLETLVAHDGFSSEQSHPKHPGYHSPANQQFSNPDPDPSLGYQDNDMDFNAATDLTGLSQNQNQNQIQHQQTTNTNLEPPPTQLAAILNPGFPTPTPLQHAQNLPLTTGFTTDFNPNAVQDMRMNHSIADANPVLGDPGSSGGWEASLPDQDILGQNIPPQNPIDDVEDQWQGLMEDDAVHFVAVNAYLECVIEINPDALQIADELDAERRDGKKQDVEKYAQNMGTKDKMQTTGGSWALLGCVVPLDAHVVSMLRKAGAIILRHANMSKWASTRSCSYSDGYSARGGQVRNPFDLVQSPFGSSGGSATDGSIAGPAQAVSVVGIKPTPGLTSRSGIIPCSENFDTVGPFGRTVLDAVLALDAITGPDPSDLRSTTAEHVSGNYVDFMTDKSALNGAKFGLPMKGVWDFVPEDQRKVAMKIFCGIREAGGEVFKDWYALLAILAVSECLTCSREHEEPSKREYTVLKVNAYDALNAYFSDLTNTSIKTVEDVVQYNIDNKGTEGAEKGDHPAFGSDVLNDIVSTKGEETKTYKQALEHIRTQTRTNGIDVALQHTRSSGETITLDALILADRRLVGQQPASQAGYPTITFPIGLDKDDMPLGLTLQQSAWQEGKLIRWASAIEDLRNEIVGERPLKTYRNMVAKNIPIKHDYT
ncbi:hypothetical protein IFR05_004748 [Cadophora sp. M221]|nr:hypothetical protein IFR05_004748 [Cadophora sp. M221]